MHEDSSISLVSIAKRVRRENPVPKYRTDCFVCHRYASICQWHHLVSVREAAEVLRNLDLPNLNVEGLLPLVSLCPTHHRVLHALDEAGGVFKHAPTIKDLNEEELKRFGKLSDTRSQDAGNFLAYAKVFASLTLSSP